MKIKKLKPPPRKICFFYDSFFSCRNDSRLQEGESIRKKSTESSTRWVQVMIHQPWPNWKTPRAVGTSTHPPVNPVTFFQGAPLAHYWRQLPGVGSNGFLPPRCGWQVGSELPIWHQIPLKKKQKTRFFEIWDQKRNIEKKNTVTYCLTVEICGFILVLAYLRRYYPRVIPRTTFLPKRFEKPTHGTSTRRSVFLVRRWWLSFNPFEKYAQVKFWIHLPQGSEVRIEKKETHFIWNLTGFSYIPSRSLT